MPNDQLPLGILERRRCRFSSDRLYRTYLRIVWDDSKPLQLFAGLNPSKADEANDDPTVRRWVDFAIQWDRGGIIVVNAFAYRSTDWRVLRKVEDPVGAGNDTEILMAIIETPITPIACWGRHVADIDPARVDRLRSMARWECLGTNEDGSPKHPLYLRKDTRPGPWNYEES